MQTYQLFYIEEDLCNNLFIHWPFVTFISIMLAVVIYVFNPITNRDTSTILITMLISLGIYFPVLIFDDCHLANALLKGMPNLGNN